MKKSFHILLIEDDQDDIELLQAALKDNNVSCTMDVVMQGDRVVPWLQTSENRPDLIVMDLNIPKIHGKELLRNIFSIVPYRYIPIIVLTTSSANDDREYCLGIGAKKFITKPCTIDGFNQTVQAIVETAMPAAE
jgi:CheY-like chemotaxis protein